MKFVFTKIPACGRMHIAGRCPKCTAICGHDYRQFLRSPKEFTCYKCYTTFFVKKIKDDQVIILTVEEKSKRRPPKPDNEQ